jgi:hypothetical protein
LFGILGLIALFLFPSLESQPRTAEEDHSIFLDASSIKDRSFPGVTSTAYEGKEWFYLDTEQQQRGPIPFEKLKSVWNEGGLHPATYVWSEGMENWKKVEELPGFTEVLRK